MGSLQHFKDLITWGSISTWAEILAHVGGGGGGGGYWGGRGEISMRLYD